MGDFNFNCPSPHEVSGNHSHDHRCCNASVDLTDPFKKSHFEVEIYGKSMENMGKIWEKIGKIYGNRENMGKRWKIYGNLWENLQQMDTSWGNLWK